VELQQLKYFHIVAENEHMTRSARQLHIAQPALSQSIRRLENELGCTLFERSGRNIRLTPAGRYLNQQVTPLLGKLDTLEDDIHGFSDEERRTVRLDIRAASGLVVDALARYSATHPNMRFEMRQHEDDPFCDLAISTHTSTRGDAEVAPDIGAQQAVFSERILLAVPHDTARNTPALSLEDLAEKRFICLSPLIAFRQICDEVCHAHGFEPRIGCESDNPSVVKRMIGLGLGVGFWPAHSWGAPDDAHAHAVPLLDEGFSRDIVIELRGNDAKPEARAFYDYLVNCLVHCWKED